MDKPLRTTSALAGVFGSQVSLSELMSEDVPEYQTTASARTASAHNRRIKPMTTFDSPNSSSVDLADTSKDYDDYSPSRGGHKRSGSSGSSSVYVRGFSKADQVMPLKTIPIIVRLGMLFSFGVLYGQVSKHLHDNGLANINILGDLNYNSSIHTLLWGMDGVIVGILFALFDGKFPEYGQRLRRGKGGYDWQSIIRALAAFVGIVYGIRKLAWTSTLQSAFYFGGLNPCLWYLLDATRNGFILSSTVSLLEAGLFALLLPQNLPSPRFTQDYFAVIAWVASVFFCCSIIAGNLGRRLISVD